MFELSKDNYGVLLDYVLKIPFNMLAARSVISGQVSGKVFVDSCERPQTFYIVHPYGMTYLCGHSGNESFNQSLFEYFEGKRYERERDDLLQAFPRDWDAVMKRLVDERKAIFCSRLNFRFDASKFHEGYSKTEKSQYEVVSTPVDMLFGIDGNVVPKYYMDSPEESEDWAKSFSVMIDGKPASTAFALALHDGQLEIGIETMKEHQGKGLAYLACAKLIEYCLDNGLEPVWSCRYENTASVSLSKKLGFIETLKMPYYIVKKNIGG